MMILKHLSIGRTRISTHGSYLSDDVNDPLVGKLTFCSKHAEMTVNLTEETSKRILALVAEDIAEAGRMAADAISADVINGTALPAPEANAAAD